MKNKTGWKQPIFQSSLSVCLALVAGVLLSAGCGKKQSAAETPAASPMAETNPASMPAAANKPMFIPPAAPTTVAAGTDGGADLKQLNHAYIGWTVQSHHRPKSFEEFVTMSGIKVPPAPAGKKYVIDKYGYINLVNQ